MSRQRADDDAAIGNLHAAQAREITSDLLFQGGRELVIVHAGERYRLRITRQNKLILNK